MDEYLAEWRKIREVIDAKMRADLRPAFIEDVPVKPALHKNPDLHKNSAGCTKTPEWQGCASRTSEFQTNDDKSYLCGRIREAIVGATLLVTPMKIDDQFLSGFQTHKGAEEAIGSLKVTELLDEIRQVIFKTKVHLNATLTTKKKAANTTGQRGTTGNKGLTPMINAYLAAGLSHHNWSSYAPERAEHDMTRIDWVKKKPDPWWPKPGGIGVGLETQFGNNFQLYADFLKLQMAFNSAEIGVGFIIVPSLELSKYLADRCANFRIAVSRLKQFFDAMLGSRTDRICPIGIIGVSHDGLAAIGQPFTLASEWAAAGTIEAAKLAKKEPKARRGKKPTIAEAMEERLEEDDD